MKQTILKRKDGRYEIRYHYGYKEDGKSNYRSIYGKTEQELISTDIKKL